MNLQSLSSYEIEQLLKKKVSQERQVTVEIINLLEEVNARRIYLQRGYGSLIEYCIKELGYSEGSAYRRVSAMRLAQEVPKVKESLSDGRLNLVNVTMAHSVFKRETQDKKPLSTEEKTLVIKSLENKTKREAEKLLLEISPLEVPIEKTRQLTRQLTEVKMVLTEGLLEKLKEIKDLWSHKNPNPNYAELLEMLADFTLQKLKLKTRGKTMVVAQNSNVQNNRTISKPINKTENQRKYIPQNLRRKILQKANNQCEFVDSITGRKCESRFQLQIEHKCPVGKNGMNEESNLELLCRAHNALRAMEHFGQEHMHKFVQ